MMSDRDDIDVIHNIAYAVRQYVPGSLGWVAKQNDKERDDVWGFVIGTGFAWLTMERARTADDALYRELATQIMGFAPDSPQDIQRRRIEANQHIREIDDTTRKLVETRDYWQRVLDNLPVIEVTR